MRSVFPGIFPGIQTIDSTQALFLPIGASVSLLVMFFFFDSVQVVFTICTAGNSLTHSLTHSRSHLNAYDQHALPLHPTPRVEHAAGLNGEMLD